jgi:hypothetical protein
LVPAFNGHIYEGMLSVQGSAEREDAGTYCSGRVEEGNCIPFIAFKFDNFVHFLSLDFTLTLKCLCQKYNI